MNTAYDVALNKLLEIYKSAGNGSAKQKAAIESIGKLGAQRR